MGTSVRNGNAQISNGIWLNVPKLNSSVLCFPNVFSPQAFKPRVPSLGHCWSLAHGFSEQHHFVFWDSGIGSWGPGSSMCTQNRYRSSFRDLLCLINPFCCRCQLPLSPGSSIPVEGVAEQVGSRWAQSSAFFVWFPFSSCLSSTVFLLLCFEGLIQDCPGLSKPGSVWPELLQVPVQVSSPSQIQGH